MIEISAELRKAYVARLANIVYFTKPIQVWDTFEKQSAIINDGTLSFSAYILLKDITVNDNSPKCNVNQNVSIQMQVVTKFNANTGESYYSEDLGNIALQKLIPTSQNKVEIGDLGLFASSWIGRLESSRQINSESATNRIFTRNYIFSHQITQ